MANLKEVRERIASINNTQQITKAMKMVSAAKLRRAQGAIQQMRPYSEKLNQILSNVLSNIEGDAVTSFGVERPIEKACIVVITSNRGLCGGFNSTLIKTANALMEGKYAGVRAKGGLSMLFVGKKGYDYFKRRITDVTLIPDYINLFDDLSFDNTQKVAADLMDKFSKGQVDAVDIVYARFRNAAVQYFSAEQFLPVAKLESTGGSAKADYIFEPNKVTLLENLIPTILKTQFQKTLLDNQASEHGARMTAMDKATTNADEILRDLKISYNKARQETITGQIMEIVGGAAALEG